MTQPKTNPVCTRNFRFRDGVVKPLSVHRATGQVRISGKWWDATVLSLAFGIHEVINSEQLGPQAIQGGWGDPVGGADFTPDKKFRVARKGKRK